MKKLPFIIILIFCFFSVNSQSCLPEGIYFFTQADIDGFESSYPGCTEIEGFVHIAGNDITNLNGLSVLTTIGGTLWFANNNSLTSLSGLNNLTSVGGALYLRKNNSLVDLSGLDNLTSVGSYIRIWENSSLTSLSGLNNLTSIGGDLDIFNNDALSTLSGIENLDPASISNLYIVDNASLSNCEAQSICDYLTGQYGSINIYDNAAGCDDPPEVASNCGATLPCLPYGNYYFTTQEHIDDFAVNYPGCTDLEGDVNITGSYITNLAGLSGITSISGALNIYWTNNLGSLMQLYNITSIGGLMINGNTFLGSLTGLHNVTAIGGSVLIINNNMLNSIMALNKVNSIGGQMWIWDNPGLTGLTGIDNIASNSITDLSIQDNASLSNCEVLSICEYLSIPAAPVLIQDNAPGCNSPFEVQDSCEANAVYINEQYIKDNLTLYPNPANQELNLSIEGFIIDETVIYTLTGKKMLQSRPANETIDVYSLPPGMYIVEVTVENRKVREKLLVQ